MAHKVIVACDFPGREALDAFLGKLGDERPYLKIGMELYDACGPDIVRDLKARGFRVFWISSCTTSRTPCAARARCWARWGQTS